MNIEILKQLGSEWKKGEKHRIYFNGLGEWYGIKTERYNTGNICGATLDGETISNSAAKRLLGRLMDCKVWFDVPTGSWFTQTNQGDTEAKEMCNACIKAIKAKAAGLETQVTA